MSKATEYATDCQGLDAARRKLAEGVESLSKWCAYVDRRLKMMYGHPMSAEATDAIIEQRDKVGMLHDILEDFTTYMDTAEAWAPALPEPREPEGVGFDLVVRANEAMDELLKKL